MITYLTIITLLAFVMAFIMTHFYFKNRDSEILYANSLDRLEELGEDMSDWKEGY